MNRCGCKVRNIFCNCVQKHVVLYGTSEECQVYKSPKQAKQSLFWGILQWILFVSLLWFV
ncbi:hypothetical protein HMPREF9441_02234 [Paraprevotella clara YIT 11840]|uniref:Uncharacterized protein n=1 Tax=Paraprevotella clara YIT 11840 TaxID=762968 RepID=G5SS84_9BACT|nr:hypothetical protein HMPREF9441_02234 [Paraprevotella clara YIT 11840]